MAYEDYRQTPQAQANLWALSRDPRQFYSDSESLWGNVGQNAAKGAAAGTAYGAATGAMVGGVGAAPGAILGAGVGLIAGAAAPLQQSFGGMHELYNGEMLTNLGNRDAWENLVSGGTMYRRRGTALAKVARANAVQKWRTNEQSRLGSLLDAQGADVRTDLGGELNAALGAGGRLGNMDAVKSEMAKFQQRYQQYMLGRSRAGQARQVDAMFADPQRMQQREQGLTAARNQGMGDIAEQYRIGQRENAFNQSRRGMQGSSVDVEKQGQLGRGRDASAQQLQGGIDAQRQQYRLGDQQQQNQLKGLIYSDDPNMASQFANTMQGIQRQGQQVQEQSQINQQQAARQSATSAGYSQALGGALSAGSKPLGYYVDHRGGGA